MISRAGCNCKPGRMWPAGLEFDTYALDGISLTSSSTVRNFGVIFDQNWSFDSHIKQFSRTAFFHLRNIVKIRNILSQGDAEKLLRAFVTSGLDYCNSLSLGCPTDSLNMDSVYETEGLCVWEGDQQHRRLYSHCVSLHSVHLRHPEQLRVL